MKPPKPSPAIDMYRVMLFKKKIRVVLHEFEKLRFRSSFDRCRIIIGVSLDYGFENAAANSQEAMDLLRRAAIEAKVIRCGGSLSISIPIDQAALPERVRRTEVAS